MRKNLQRIKKLEEANQKGFSQIDNLLIDKKKEISDFDDDSREENLFDHDLDDDKPLDL